jgi:uncharacterized protein (DUF1015 family)
VEPRLADVKPFRAIRYNEAKYADLSPVLAPPYDVITPGESKYLREQFDHNVVQLMLPPPGSSNDNDARYERAARCMEEWLFDEILAQDRAPGVYLLEQEFEVDGVKRTRRAFIARLRLEAFGRGLVFPHEETMPGPKADRLDLMKANGMNMSQVFGIYRDDGRLAPVLDEMSRVRPLASGIQPEGVTNTLRAVYHRPLIDTLAEAFSDRKVIIADGHHRYETAIAYRDLMRTKNGPGDFNEPYEFVSAALVSSSDPGLVVLPTHRVVSGLKGFLPRKLFEAAAEEYELEDSEPDAERVLARLKEVADRHSFGIVTRRGTKILVRKKGVRDATGSPEDLDVHLLHDEILGQIVGLEPADMAEDGRIKYLHDAAAAVKTVALRRAHFAVLLNPVRVDEVEAIALAGERMPPKSTFFSPKLPAGLLINPLV